MIRHPLVWALTDDRAGNVAQALGVAESLEHDFTAKPVRYTPLARLPNVIQGASLIGLTVETRMTLTPPWPDVVIAAGRRTAPVARWIKHHAGKRVVLAHIMNPGSAGAEDFDLIALPRHDSERSSGDAANVLRITGAPHRLTAERLASAADAWAARLAALPRPRIALIVGGATHRKPFPAERARDLAARVGTMAGTAGGSILLATSRRTGPEAERILRTSLPQPHHAFFWGAGGDNPYFGYLALADAIVVTGDSVSMCSEACAASAPVFIDAPPGTVAPKHARLHDELYAAGFAQPFEGRLTAARHPPLNAANEVARAIEVLLEKEFPATGRVSS